MENVKIKLNKTQFEFHLGLGFLGNLVRREKTSFEKVMKEMTENPFLMIPVVMYESAKKAARRNKEEFPYTLEEFEDFIDDDGGITSKGVSDFMTEFTNAMQDNTPKETKSVGKPQAKRRAAK